MPYACAVDHSASSRYAGSQIVNAIDASDRGAELSPQAVTLADVLGR